MDTKLRRTKLKRLLEIEGFGSLEDLARSALSDCVSPAICVDPDCDYTANMEPDQDRGYCENCGNLVHEVQLQVRDIVADLPPVFEAFYADDAARTCAGCGTLHPGKG